MTQAQDKQHENKRGAKVVVVDDHRPTAEALFTILKRDGFAPVMFHRGEDALAYLQANRPAAAVVDIHLPDMCGLDLSAKFRTRMGEGPPIIVLSGDHSIENLRRLAEVGATYFLAKPIRSEVLVEKLRERLGAGAGQRSMPV